MKHPIESKVEFKRERSAPTGMTLAIRQDGEVVGWAKDRRTATLFAWGLSMESVLHDAGSFAAGTQQDLERAIAKVMRHMAVMAIVTQRVRFWRHLGRKGSLYTSRLAK